MQLEGKRIVVTGAGQGLGRAYAEAIARHGASVILNDVNSESVEDVAASIERAGGTAKTAIGSVSEWEDAGRAVSECVQQFGGIDAIVNNAGLHTTNGFLDEDHIFARRLIEVNVVGTIFCSLHAARRMAEQGSGGAILNVSSGAASGLPMMATYGASKGAVASLTWNLAGELREFGIRVNAISPAAVTSMLEAKRKVSPSAVTWGPELMTPLVIFLLSDLSRNITGQIVRQWENEVHLMKHHGLASPRVRRDPWTPEEFAAVFDSELKGQLQPYQRDMEGYPPFTSQQKSQY
jgi:NAD(P)-dependent dehydrogenase (short-subunit alcohol dehydrogenase family)